MTCDGFSLGITNIRVNIVCPNALRIVMHWTEFSKEFERVNYVIHSL